MDIFNRHQAMLVLVAKALGKDLLQRVAFVGGSVTGLLLTDEFTKEQVRYTDDVDVIVDVIGHLDWHRFEQMLRKRGFEDDQCMACRMRFKDLKIDFMPSDESILGFTNRWYAQALKTAEDHPLKEDLTVRIVTPPFFLATKLEAYRGRGNNDPLQSHDIEDLINLVDGRPSIIDEISCVDTDVRTYIAEKLRGLLAHPGFEYAIQSAAQGDRDREKLIFERIELMVK